VIFTESEALLSSYSTWEYFAMKTQGYVKVKNKDLKKAKK
jgi:hypothetical protein